MEERKSGFTVTLRDLKTELESRLDSQRVHMVYKESTLQNQIDDLKTKVDDLLRESKSMKANEVQREEEYRSIQLERREVVDWLKNLKYQDDLSEKYCGSCSKRYMYVRKEPLSSFAEQVNSTSSSNANGQDALLSSLRTTRAKPRSLCPSPVSELFPGRTNMLRTNSEESCLNRASLEYWRRNVDSASNYSTNTLNTESLNVPSSM
ncbi:hypothetical protein QZH41_012873 [Actinostola sp. cb2023]|nr:hypothetical protein QZH41_012873 [Actinostola sp. cb2023]